MLITHANFAKGFRGGERQTQLLIEQLSLLGYQQRLLVRKKSKLIQRCKNIQNLEIIEITKPYIFNLKYVKNSSIIHAHETKALQFAYFAKKIRGIPYIVTRRVDNKIKNNFLNAKFYTNAKVVIALSSAIKNEILKITQNANIAIIPSAYTDADVDSKKSLAIKKRFQSNYLVGNVGALDDAHKGQSTLIEAAKALEKSHPDIHFIFVGGGQDEEKLKLQAKSLKNVTFEGFVNNVNDYISSFDLFVFPSNNEGLGSILLDVIRLDTPIIASKVGGIVDIIEDGINGILTPPKDAQAIKDNIDMLYNNPQKAKKLADNAKKNIDKYSPQNMALSYKKIYERKKYK